MVRDVYTGKTLVVSGERPWWSVQLDIGGIVSADECLLTPIDDHKNKAKIEESENDPSVQM